MSDSWIIGETARLSVVITNSVKAVSDPAALRIKVKSPGGVMTTYEYGTSGEIVKDSAGNYHLDLLLDAVGGWVWRWESDAPSAGATEGALTVKKSMVI